MPPHSHGRVLYGFDDVTNGLAANMAAPPSTLAAQLVQNISVGGSSRSSRPDENQELKSMIADIEKVKNHPELLETAQQRVDHNHLLIYVCVCVVLDSLRWDDPFANVQALHVKVLTNLDFLKVTIKETPVVLRVTADGEGFLLRNKEPLWLWILPKVLQHLGHPRCLDLTPAIAEFCRFLLLTIFQFNSLYPERPTALRYFQGTVSGGCPRAGCILD